MKVTKEDYQMIKNKVSIVVDGLVDRRLTFRDFVDKHKKNPKIKNADRATLWELFYASRIDWEIQKMYKAVHLETCMKKIIKELCDYDVNLSEGKCNVS